MELQNIIVVMQYLFVFVLLGVAFLVGVDLVVRLFVFSIIYLSVEQAFKPKQEKDLNSEDILSAV